MDLSRLKAGAGKVDCKYYRVKWLNVVTIVTGMFANRVDPDQKAFKEQSDVALQCTL